MRGVSPDQLVYGQLFPNRSSRDPADFGHFVQRHIIPEVRREVLAFFGHLDTDEARYPGLDYNNRIHRIRLGRWRHHRELFRAFDALRLTPSEISALTRWEGTKWARDNHEYMRGEPIRDTASEHMPHWAWNEPRPVYRDTGRPAPPRTLRPKQDRMAGIAKDAEYEIARPARYASAARLAGNITATMYHDEDDSLPCVKNDGNLDTCEPMDEDDDEDSDYDDEEEDDDDEEEVDEDGHDIGTDGFVGQKDDFVAEQKDRDMDNGENVDEDEAVISVGEALNERLRAQAARRNAGDMNVVMDPEWEAWLAWFKNSADQSPEPLSPAYMTAAAAAAAATTTRALPGTRAAASPAPPSPSRTTPRSFAQHRTHHHHHHHHHSQQSPYSAAQQQQDQASSRWYQPIRRHQQHRQQQLPQQQQQQRQQSRQYWPDGMPPPDEIVRVPARS